MIKYYLISYVAGLSGRSTFGHCLMEVVDSDITGIQKMIQDVNNFTAPPVILCLKDLSEEEYKMLRGGEK